MHTAHGKKANEKATKNEKIHLFFYVYDNLLLFFFFIFFSLRCLKWPQCVVAAIDCDCFVSWRYFVVNIVNFDFIASLAWIIFRFIIIFCCSLFFFRVCCLFCYGFGLARYFHYSIQGAKPAHKDTEHLFKFHRTKEL